MYYQMVTWPMTSRDPRRWCEAVRSATLATAWLLVTMAVIRHFPRIVLLSWYMYLNRITPLDVSSLAQKWANWLWKDDNKSSRRSLSCTKWPKCHTYGRRTPFICISLWSRKLVIASIGYQIKKHSILLLIVFYEVFGPIYAYCQSLLRGIVSSNTECSDCSTYWEI